MCLQSLFLYVDLDCNRFSGDAPPAALRFSVGFRSVRLLRRAPVYGGAERRRLYIIYGRTSQGQTRNKPYVNRISTVSEKSCQNEVISVQFWVIL